MFVRRASAQKIFEQKKKRKWLANYEEKKVNQLQIKSKTKYEFFPRLTSNQNKGGIVCAEWQGHLRLHTHAKSFAWLPNKWWWFCSMKREQKNRMSSCVIYLDDCTREYCWELEDQEVAKKEITFVGTMEGSL